MFNFVKFVYVILIRIFVLKIKENVFIVVMRIIKKKTAILQILKNAIVVEE